MRGDSGDRCRKRGRLNGELQDKMVGEARQEEEGVQLLSKGDGGNCGVSREATALWARNVGAGEIRRTVTNGAIG